MYTFIHIHSLFLIVLYIDLPLKPTETVLAPLSALDGILSSQHEGWGTEKENEPKPIDERIHGAYHSGMGDGNPNHPNKG